MKYILALDIGTSSMRAILYSQEGRLCFSRSREYESTFPKPSYVEQWPSSWAQAAQALLGEAGQFLRERRLAVEGIAVASQRSSLIALGEDGAVLRPAIMWQDKRAKKQCDCLEQRASFLYQKTGLRIDPYFVLPKILWMREREPELFSRASKLIGVQDFVVHSLTGDYVTDWTQASRTMLMDIRTCEWDASLLAVAGIEKRHLCRLVAPGTTAGYLRKEVAKQTALPAGLPIVIAGGDQQNAAVAMQVTKPGVAEVNVGTGSFALSCTQEPVWDPAQRIVCQSAAVAGAWVAEAGTYNAGSIYRWFCRQFCKDLGHAAYGRMDEEARKSSLGANGVVLMPHFEGSAAPHWNPQAKGVFFNLSLGTGRADMLRAILEGIALEIAENLRLMQALTGEIRTVNVAGGMTKSDLFCAILANACERPVYRYENTEASSLGACVVAAPALGIYGDVAEAVSRMTREPHDAFLPDREWVKRYEKLRMRREMLYAAIDRSGVFAEYMQPL